VTILARLGTDSSSIGDVSTAPTDVFGYIKRAYHLQEGDQTFNKATGTWLVQNKGGTVTLAVKTIATGNTLVTKV